MYVYVCVCIGQFYKSVLSESCDRGQHVLSKPHTLPTRHHLTPQIDCTKIAHNCVVCLAIIVRFVAHGFGHDCCNSKSVIAKRKVKGIFQIM